MTNAERQKAYRQRLKDKANDKKLQAEIAEKKRIAEELSALRTENAALKAEIAALKSDETAELEHAFLRGLDKLERAFLRNLEKAIAAWNKRVKENT